MIFTSRANDSSDLCRKKMNDADLKHRKRDRKQSSSEEPRKTEGEVELLTFHQIPVHLRFNSFVLSHYRPPTNFVGCLKSLFYLHNETVNIITHAIPLIGILVCVPTMLPWDSITIPYLPKLHVVASLAPWIGSILYHLFMNHQHGYPVYKAVLTIDVIGIWVTQTTGGLVTICATIFCLDPDVQRKILTAYAFLCVYCLYKAVSAKCPWGRRFSFTAPILVRFFMIVLRAMGKGGGAESSFPHVIYQDLIGILGACIGASNIPERWFPGALDLFCNSHHLMHVLVVYAVYHMHAAATMDLEWMSRIDQGESQCNQNHTSLPTLPIYGAF